MLFSQKKFLAHNFFLYNTKSFIVLTTVMTFEEKDKNHPTETRLRPT